MRGFVIKKLILVVILCVSWAAYAQPAPAPRTDEEERTIAIYKQSSHAVALILTKNLTVDPFSGYLLDEGREGSGSGIIIDAQKGLIVTNYHVIADAAKVEVLLDEKESYQAKLLGYDQDSDLAVLQLKNPPENLVAIPLSDSTTLEVGQRVLAIGNPFGLNRTLTTGVISSLNRAVKSPQGKTLKGLIQTDASINPGNSGGPLLDMAGRLIGMNSAIVSSSGDSAGIGFAVPVNVIKRLLPELINTGKVSKPQIGWVIDDTEYGPMVRFVAKGSPAAKAGIEGAYRAVSDGFLRGYVVDYARADLIEKIDNENVSSKDEIEDIIAKSERGRAITFTLRRGGPQGKARTVSIEPEFS
jgi:S1-C subfamily serine protease